MWVHAHNDYSAHIWLDQLRMWYVNESVKMGEQMCPKYWSYTWVSRVTVTSGANWIKMAPFQHGFGIVHFFLMFLWLLALLSISKPFIIFRKAKNGVFKFKSLIQHIFWENWKKIQTSNFRFFFYSIGPQITIWTVHPL